MAMMATKKSLYLNDEMLSIWDSIPADERGEVIRKALRDYANQSDDDPNLREIRKTEIELQNLQNSLELIKKNVVDKEMRLEELRGEKNTMTIDYVREWNDHLKRAREAEQGGEIWESYAGRAEYRVHAVSTDERVYLENINTGRTTSNYQKGTFELGLRRLMDRGGRIKQGDMIPVNMHEYAVVSLHPRLHLRGGYIVFE
tara:strand:- start:56 stop:658 length:603 start_codon:yes stop_codon:yes gene_type:complete